jgi:hypothetical protein
MSAWRGQMAKTVKSKLRPLTFRDFPRELYWRAKACAAHREMRFKAYVVAALEEATEKDLKRFSIKRSGENAD